MDYEPFVVRVEQRADVGRERAEALIQATLRTLAERISGGEAREVAEQLPAELRPALTGAEEAPERFEVDEFVRRVADRSGEDSAKAAAGARAVMITLREAVPRREFDGVTTQLPKDFLELLGAIAEGR